MILGTSHSSFGLVPEVFEKNAHRNVYNYSFTIADSPWGEDYYNSICKKLDTTRNDGLFILAVDPFSVSSKVTNIGEEIIPQKKLSKISSVTASPNYEYIYKMNVKPWRYMLMLLHLEKKKFKLHNDGWYEVLRLYDKTTEKKWTTLKVKNYRSKYGNRKLSNHRMKYLKCTIQKLKKYGKVVLVRIPSSTDMYNFECEYMPMFDSLMNSLSKQYQIHYFNFAQESGKYRTFDGNHLIPEDARLFTQILCDSIGN